MSNFLTNAIVDLLGNVPPRIWWVLWVGAYAAGGLVLLWALSLIKNLAGWPGVVVVLLAVTYTFAYARGKLDQPFNPFDNPISAIIEVLK